MLESITSLDKKSSDSTVAAVMAGYFPQTYAFVDLALVEIWDRTGWLAHVLRNRCAMTVYIVERATVQPVSYHFA
jgi:hypothetical protein